MKLPGWAMAVGIIMMLFGGCGALNNVQKIYAPKILDDSSGFMEEISKSIEEDFDDQIQHELTDTLDDGTVQIDSSELKKLESAQDMMSGMLNISDYYKKWVYRFGILGTIVAVLYFLAGLLLVLGKQYSLKLVYGALALSLASLVFQIIIMSMDKDSGVLAMASNMGAYFMIFVNIVLLVIVLASDKSFFFDHDIEEV